MRNFTKDESQELIIESGFKGAVSLVKTSDRSTLIRVERDFTSTAFRVRFIDPQTDREIFEMNRILSNNQYYAEHPDGSDRSLFDIQITTSKFGGPSLNIEFLNIAKSNAKTQFEYKIRKFSKASQVTWEGNPVAEIKEAKLGTSLQIAPHVDPLPIIAMEIALMDNAREKTKNKAALVYFNNQDSHGAGMSNAAFAGGMFGSSKT